ncbi:MAG: hypothetical protein MHPSP_001310 [Paramarteilia canceri]
MLHNVANIAPKADVDQQLSKIKSDSSKDLKENLNNIPTKNEPDSENISPLVQTFSNFQSIMKPFQISTANNNVEKSHSGSEFSKMIDMLTSSEPNTKYWQMLAEERGKIIEQQMVKITKLEEERQKYKELSEQGVYFAELYDIIKEESTLKEK